MYHVWANGVQVTVSSTVTFLRQNHLPWISLPLLAEKWQRLEHLWETPETVSEIPYGS